MVFICMQDVKDSYHHWQQHHPHPGCRSWWLPEWWKIRSLLSPERSRAVKITYVHFVTCVGTLTKWHGWWYTVQYVAGLMNKPFSTQLVHLKFFANISSSSFRFFACCSYSSVTTTVHTFKAKTHGWLSVMSGCHDSSEWATESEHRTREHSGCSMGIKFLWVSAENDERGE